MLEFGGLVCGGDSGVADGGVVGGHGLRVSKRAPWRVCWGAFSVQVFGMGFSGVLVALYSRTETVLFAFWWGSYLTG